MPTQFRSVVVEETPQRQSDVVWELGHVFGLVLGRES